MPSVRQRSNRTVRYPRIGGFALTKRRHGRWAGGALAGSSLFADATGLRDLALGLALPLAGRRYLHEFRVAWKTSEMAASRREFEAALKRASLILVGDYHALPASQLYIAELLRFLTSNSTQAPVLGLECFCSRQQSLLDSWFDGDFDTARLFVRTDFDQEWGYAREPYEALLATAQACGTPVFGLDLIPRAGFHRLRERDRHMARRLANVRAAVGARPIVVLVGESHLAPSHLPHEIEATLPGEKPLLILQNLDQVYSRVRGQHRVPVPVRLAENTYCVFTAHPEEKYQCFREYLEAWAA